MLGRAFSCIFNPLSQ